MMIAEGLAPLDGSCTPTPTPHKIGLLSIGMCNAWSEFGGGGGFANDAFQKRAAGLGNNRIADHAKSDDVVIINGAQPGKDAKKWAGNVTDEAWTTAVDKVHAAGLCPEQVEVVWMEHAVKDPSGAFLQSAHDLQTMLTTIVQNVHTLFPNCKMAFLSTRTRAFTTTFHNPEPYAYETGFADKWTIESQIDHTALNFKLPGTIVAPYIAWGPYYWVDGPNPRSDFKIWTCNDLQDDWVHPSACGVHKVADQLLAFFETSPLTTPWYLKPAGTLTITNANYSLCHAANAPPNTVQFCASVTGGTGSYIYSWDFDDGDYDYDDPAPRKSFPASGTTYHVNLTVVDSAGANARTTINVTPP